MADFIVSFILLAILVPVICYMISKKKKGQKCIGCPHASKCSSNCQSHKEK